MALGAMHVAAWRELLTAGASTTFVAIADGDIIGHASAVAADNPRAQSFYRRNGFAVVGDPVRTPFLLDEIDEVQMVR